MQSSHSFFMSPNPINQPDGEINESINEPKIEAQDLLFDLSSMLNKITASIIDLAKMMNNKKMQESNPVVEEEVKMNVSEDSNLESLLAMTLLPSDPKRSQDQRA